MSCILYGAQDHSIVRKTAPTPLGGAITGYTQSRKGTYETPGHPRVTTSPTPGTGKISQGHSPGWGLPPAHTTADPRRTAGSRRALSLLHKGVAPKNWSPTHIEAGEETANDKTPLA